MIVFIGGMMRSGSTFTFNVARSLLAARGSVYHEPNPALISLLKSAGGYDHLLFKAHSIEESTASLTKLGAVKTILTVRKPEDSIASLMRTFAIPLDESITITQNWLQHVAPLSRHSLTLTYETIDTQPAKAISAIAGYLAIDAGSDEQARIAHENDKAEVKKRSDSLSETGPGVKNIGFSYYNEETYYHRRHISSVTSERAVDLLPPADIQKIRSSLSAFTGSGGDLIAAL